MPPGDLGERRAAVPAQGKERHEDDSLLGAVVDDRLGGALREGVVVLDRNDRNDPSGPLDLFDHDVGDSDVADLALVAKLLDGAPALPDWCVRVDAMQGVEVDRFGPAAEAALLEL